VKNRLKPGTNSSAGFSSGSRKRSFGHRHCMSRTSLQAIAGQ
jgi:hypothetical protein